VTTDDLNKADLKFLRDNISFSPLRLAAALGVSSQTLIRMPGKPLHNPTTPKAVAWGKYQQDVLRIMQAANNANPKPRKQKARQSHDITNRLPAATAITTTNVSPKYTQGDNGVTVRGRDLITTVPGSANFTLTSYAVNPGQFRLFPVLSDRARSYEQYRVKNLTFEWIPLSGTDRSGSVYLCFNPEATTPNPRNEQTLSAMSGSVCGPVYGTNTKVRVSNNGGKILYVRSDILTGGQDLRTTDFGRFFVATTDCSSSAALGKLYVNYEIELKYPRSGVLSPMIANGPASVSGVNLGNMFDFIYNGDSQQKTDSTVYPVSGQDFAWFNSSSGVNYIYYRKPGTYLTIVHASQSPSASPTPFVWVAGVDTELVEQHYSDGLQIGNIIWYFIVQVNKPNGTVLSSTVASTMLINTPQVIITEVSDTTNDWARAH
jgi:hypothetical protein